MLRVAAGVVAGLIAWVVVATLGNLAVRAIMPGYTEVEAAMAFSPAMLWMRLVLGAVSSLSAGFVAAWVAKRRSAADKILAGVLLVLFIPMHYMLWDRFPVWYHLTFLLTLALMPVLGAMCYARCARSISGKTAS